MITIVIVMVMIIITIMTMIIVVIVLISLSIHAWWQTSLFVLVDPTWWHWAQKSSATIEH